MPTFVWFVVGDEIHYIFETKYGAEMYARELFPDEDTDKHYSRIRSIQVRTEDEVKYL